MDAKAFDGLLEPRFLLDAAILHQHWADHARAGVRRRRRASQRRFDFKHIALHDVPAEATVGDRPGRHRPATSVKDFCQRTVSALSANKTLEVSIQRARMSAGRAAFRNARMSRRKASSSGGRRASTAVLLLVSTLSPARPTADWRQPVSPEWTT